MTMRIDYVAIAILSGLIVFSIIMFIVIRSQSKKSEHPDALISNASNPTLLCHAPPDSQSAYSMSMLSLSKLGTPEPNASTTDLEEDGKKFKRKLFYEDTRDSAVLKRGSLAV